MQSLSLFGTHSVGIYAVPTCQVGMNFTWIGPPLRAGCCRREQHAQQERD